MNTFTLLLRISSANIIYAALGNWEAFLPDEIHEVGILGIAQAGLVTVQVLRI